MPSAKEIVEQAESLGRRQAPRGGFAPPDLEPTGRRGRSQVGGVRDGEVGSAAVGAGHRSAGQ